MKHLKVYEAHNESDFELTVSVTDNLIELLLTTIGDLCPNNLLYDYDYETFAENERDDKDDDDNMYELSDENGIGELHDELINNFDYDEYYSSLLPHIQKWFKNDGLEDMILEQLPFIKSITHTEIKYVKNGGYEIHTDIILNQYILMNDILTLLDDGNFTNFIAEQYSSYDGFYSFMPNTEIDIIEILEKATHDDFWKLVSILFEYHKKTISEEFSDGEGLMYYVQENIASSIYDYQK